MSNKKVQHKIIHGLSRHPLYNTYAAMIHRCYDANTESYPNYGGRGIEVCEEWLNNDNYSGLKLFVKWGMANGYKKGLSIERVDIDGNYTPENCTFITMAEQQANKQFTRYITINGITKHLAEWSRISGIGTNTITQRIELGWNEDDLLRPPTINQASRQSGIVGITWNKTRQRWKIEIRHNNKSNFLGWYKNINEAIKVHKEFCEDNEIKIKYKKIA